MNVEKVIICDDSPVERKILGKILSKLGFDVEVVSQGTDLVERTRHESFRFIFLDLVMPHQDGWETSREIRKQENAVHTPIIAVSSVSQSYDIERAKICGVNVFLPKPFGEKEVLQAMKEAS